MTLQTESKKEQALLARLLGLLYGLVVYLVFLATALYAVGFVGNLLVPKAIDTGSSSSGILALLINLSLLSLFGLQHSIMARQAFKRWWTQIIPAHLERSTYVLFASLLLLLLYWQWQPLPTVIWNVEETISHTFLLALFAGGWLLVFVSTFLIDHFELFGLRQVFSHWQGKDVPALGFRTPSLYKLVRHPLMLSFLIAFWATPRMTLGHLLFAGAMTIYILIGVRLEERDLLAWYGQAYKQYQKQAFMLLPLPRKRNTSLQEESNTEQTVWKDLR